jgi:hypothetical protein
MIESESVCGALRLLTCHVAWHSSASCVSPSTQFALALLCWCSQVSKHKALHAKHHGVEMKEIAEMHGSCSLCCADIAAPGGPPGSLPEESMEILEISASLPLAHHTQPAPPASSGGSPPAVFASNPFPMGAPGPGPVAESRGRESSSTLPGTDNVFGWPGTGA